MSNKRMPFVVGLCVSLSACAHPTGTPPHGPLAPDDSIYRVQQRFRPYYPGQTRIRPIGPLLQTDTTWSVGAENALYSLIKAERASAGAPPIRLDAVARDVAREHSRDMATRNYLALAPSTLGLLRAAGHRVDAAAMAVNKVNAVEREIRIRDIPSAIYRDASAVASMALSDPALGWLTRDTRAEILSPRWTHGAVGIYFHRPTQDYYITLVYLVPTPLSRIPSPLRTLAPGELVRPLPSPPATLPAPR